MRLNLFFKDRESSQSGNTTGVIQEFLRQLDGFSGEGFVLVIAATNQPWILDKAILSRFEKRIFVSLPDDETRKKILEIHTIKKGYKVEVSISEISNRTDGFSGRDLSYLCNEAIRSMLRRANAGLIEKIEGNNGEGMKMEKYKISEITKTDFDFA
ncbi:ATPase, AAA-type, core domain protein, partial [mine drainage metagenome]